MTNQEIITRGELIRDETVTGANTAQRVGEAFVAIGENLEEVTNRNEPIVFTESKEMNAFIKHLFVGVSRYNGTIDNIYASYNATSKSFYLHDAPSAGNLIGYIDMSSLKTHFSLGYTNGIYIHLLVNESIFDSVSISRVKLTNWATSRVFDPRIKDNGFTEGIFINKYVKNIWVEITDEFEGDETQIINKLTIYELRSTYDSVSGTWTQSLWLRQLNSSSQPNFRYSSVSENSEITFRNTSDIYNSVIIHATIDWQGLREDNADFRYMYTFLTPKAYNKAFWGKEDAAYVKTLNDNNTVPDKYRKSANGAIATLKNHFYSYPIRVVKGSVFVANDVGSSSAQSSVAMLSFVDASNNFISLILYGDGAGTYTHTFEQDGFVSISGHSNDIPKFSIETKVDYLIDDLNERMGDAETGISHLTEEIERTGNVITEFDDSNIVPGKYRKSANGAIATVNNLFYSLPIPVAKGSVFTATGVGSSSAQSSVAMLSFVDASNNFISLILNPAEAGTYTYTFTAGGYACASGALSDISKFRITTPFASQIEQNTQSIHVLEGRVDELSAVDVKNGLPILSEHPLERVTFNTGLIGIFQKIGIIGDSLASGEMQGWLSDGTKRRIDMYALSWGQQIAKMTGMDVFNFTQGGQYCKAWCNGNTAKTWDANDVANGAHSNLRQCYFIGLAHNDYTQVNNGTYTGGIGDVSTDIDLNNHANNADSYVGWYAKIIQLIKSVEPRAYIFCITSPPDSTTYVEYNAKVRQIVDLFGSSNRVFLIDLETYSRRGSDAWYKMGDHLSSAGYLFAAYEIMNYVDWIIRNNGSIFKYASLVGTELLDENPLV